MPVVVVYMRVVDRDPYDASYRRGVYADKNLIPGWTIYTVINASGELLREHRVRTDLADDREEQRLWRWLRQKDSGAKLTIIKSA